MHKNWYTTVNRSACNKKILTKLQNLFNVSKLNKFVKSDKYGSWLVWLALGPT